MAMGRCAQARRTLFRGGLKSIGLPVCQLAGPSRVPYAVWPSIPRRTFVSLNDLARLSPFGTSDDKRSGSEQGQATDGYEESVTLSFPQQHLYNVISDVAKYEQFVPYCTESRIIPGTTTTTDADLTKFHAELAVGFGSIRERYTSKVTLDRPRSVLAQAIPTPLFQHLQTCWSLTALSEHQTKVHLSIRYAFSNPLYAVMAKQAMHKMSSKMIGAFRQRAEELQQQPQ